MLGGLGRSSADVPSRDTSATFATYDVGLDGHRVSERGSADAALSGTVRAQGVTATSVGARAATQITLGDVVLTPSVTLGWQHAFGDLAPRASLRFAGGGAFGVSGVPVVGDAALVGAGLSYDLSDVSAVRVNYTGQLAPKATQNAFTAEYSHRF